jgi:hypothetical protein
MDPDPGGLWIPNTDEIHAWQQTMIKAPLPILCSIRAGTEQNESLAWFDRRSSSSSPLGIVSPFDRQLSPIFFAIRRLVIQAQAVIDEGPADTGKFGR